MADVTRNRYATLLKSKMSPESYQRLVTLENEKLFDFIGEYVELCQPDSVYMCDDSDADAEYIRKKALISGRRPHSPGKAIPSTMTDTTIRGGRPGQPRIWFQKKTCH